MSAESKVIGDSVDARSDDTAAATPKGDDSSASCGKKKRVVLKAVDRLLPGFEETSKSTTWTTPFFFVQAADTQLGMIVNYGDGTIR